MQNSNRVRQRGFRGTSRWTRATAHFFAGALIHGFIVPSHVKRAVPRRLRRGIHGSLKANREQCRWGGTRN